MFKILLIVMIFISGIKATEPINMIITKDKKKKNFGDNINIIGEWEIKSKNAIHFLVSVGYDWKVIFRKDGYIIKDEDKEINKIFPSSLKWKYKDNGVVGIEFSTKEIEQDIKVKKILSRSTNDEIKIIKYLKDKCFLVKVINRDAEVTMCKINGNLLTDSSKSIKIEIN